MFEIPPVVSSLSAHYGSLLQKHQEIIITKYSTSNDLEKVKSFRKKFGVILHKIAEIEDEKPQASLHVFSPWNEGDFLIEFGVILSFLPEDFRSNKKIVRVLFTSLYIARIESRSVISSLKKFYESQVNKIQADFSLYFGGMLPNNLVIQYIQGITVEELLKRLIPYMDSRIRSGDLAEKLYFLFKPIIKRNTYTLQKCREMDDFFTPLNLVKKSKLIQNPLPLFPTLIWDYSNFSLVPFRIFIVAKPEIISNPNFRSFLRNHLQKLKYVLTFSINRTYVEILGIVPDDWEDFSIQIRNVLDRLKRRWITAYSYGFLVERQIKIDSHATRFLSNTAALKHKNLRYKQIQESAPFYRHESKMHKSKIEIFHLDLFFGFLWRNLFPSFIFMQSSLEYFAKMQKNMEILFIKNREFIQEHFNQWWPFSKHKFSHRLLREQVLRLGENHFFQAQTKTQFLLSQIFHEIDFQIICSIKLEELENFLPLYSKLSYLGTKGTSKNSKTSSKNLQTFIFYCNWEDYLLFIPIICLLPNWGFFTREEMYRGSKIIEIIPSFNEETQKWNHEAFDPEELAETLDVPIKINPYALPKHPPVLSVQPFEPQQISRESEIKRYQKVFRKLKCHGVNHKIIENFLQHRFKKPRFDESDAEIYDKKLAYYLNQYENIGSNPFPAPIDHFFTRIHVILRSITQSVHPEALQQDPILRGLFCIGLVECWCFGGQLDGILLLEYYIPTSILSDGRHEFTRLLRKIQYPRFDVTIKILEVEHSQTFYNAYYLQAEDWEIGEFLKIRIPTSKPLQNGFTSVLFHQFKPLAATPKADIVQTWYDDSHLTYSPVFGDWYQWLFLQHPITHFVYISDVPKNQLEMIYSFFRQAPIGEIYTCQNYITKKQEVYILLRYRRQFFWMRQKIIEFFTSLQLNGFHSFVFPWTRFSSSAVSKIIHHSRKNPWYHQSCYQMQFPIFQHYQRSRTYSPREQLEMFELIPTLRGPKGGIPTVKKVKAAYEIIQGRKIPLRRKRVKKASVMKN